MNNKELKEFFDLLNHLTSRGEKENEFTTINPLDVLSPKEILISVNNSQDAEKAKILISGSFYNFYGKVVKGKPVEMSLEDAHEFAQGIIAAVHHKVDEIIENMEENDEQ